MTTGISLVRENAQAMQPPRSLWVTFPLGRPLGVPNDAAFQHRVIAAALTLLERDQGPALEDFPEDATNLSTDSADVESALACPVSFVTPQSHDTWQDRLSRELASLTPWYELGRRRRGGRTLVGVSKLTVEENTTRLARYLEAKRLPTDDLHWFKQAIEDLKTYYVEALTAQPGNYDQKRVYETLWFETQLGAALAWFNDGFRAHPKLKSFARIVLPRDAVLGNPSKLSLI